MKLALAGLAGVERSTVELGRAVVVYDPRRIAAPEIAAAVQRATSFGVAVRIDTPLEKP